MKRVLPPHVQFLVLFAGQYAALAKKVKELKRSKSVTDTIENVSARDTKVRGAAATILAPRRRAVI
jgi:hypothetical protein